MKTKHTAGPWEAMRNTEIGSMHDTTNNDWFIGSGYVIGTDGSVVIGETLASLPNYEGTDMDAEKLEANARLMAAAPELLEAVKLALKKEEDYLLELWDSCGDRKEEIEICKKLIKTYKKAIAKAEGK